MQLRAHHLSGGETTLDLIEALRRSCFYALHTKKEFGLIDGFTVAWHRALFFFCFYIGRNRTNRQKWISRIFLVGTRDNDVYGEHGKLW